MKNNKKTKAAAGTQSADLLFARINSALKDWHRGKELSPDQVKSLKILASALRMDSRVTSVSRHK